MAAQSLHGSRHCLPVFAPLLIGPRGFFGHSSSRLRLFAGFIPSMPFPRTCHLSVTLRSVPDFLIFAEVPAVAVGPEPGRRRYIIRCRCVVDAAPPGNPGGEC
jgi:hypothetical protein